MASSRHKMALPEGSPVGRYRVNRVLGSGGFGIVYHGHSVLDGREVAIKELFPGMSVTREMETSVVPRGQHASEEFKHAMRCFLIEGDMLRECSHPSVVNVIETFAENGTAYLVMDYVKGKTLSQFLEQHQRPLSQQDILLIVKPLLEGLGHVHSYGILHRDIKPDNIFIGDNGHPLLLDFGAARYASGAVSRTLTSVLTPGFAPFEQYPTDGSTGNRQGPWTDIHAMAAVILTSTIGGAPPDISIRMLPRSTQSHDPDIFSEANRARYSPQFLEAVEVMHDPDRGTQLLKGVRPGAPRAFFENYSPEFLSALDWGFQIQAEKRPRDVEQWWAAMRGAQTEPLRYATRAVQQKKRVREASRLGLGYKLAFGALTLGLLVASGFFIRQVVEDGFFDGGTETLLAQRSSEEGASPAGGSGRGNDEYATGEGEASPSETSRDEDTTGSGEAPDTDLANIDPDADSPERRRQREPQQSSPDANAAPSEEPVDLPTFVIGSGEPFLELPHTPEFGIEQVFVATEEVSRGEFREFVNATGYTQDTSRTHLQLQIWDGDEWVHSPDATWDSGLGFSQSENHPVCGVSWRDCQAFIRWKNQVDREQLDELSTHAVYRLPSDLEFSIALGMTELVNEIDFDPNRRSRTDSLRLWRDADPISEGYVIRRATTAPVSEGPINRYGFRNLIGNAAEWVHDPFRSLQSMRVVRGGSFFAEDSTSSAAYGVKHREGVYLNRRRADRGFRLAVVVPE
ncbi:MAG: SUMF1/EgtB/PvdO family nonheme iron enzyme [Verrucomicrobiota bacterium]